MSSYKKPHKSLYDDYFILRTGDNGEIIPDDSSYYERTEVKQHIADKVIHNGVTYAAIKQSFNVEPGVTSGWADYWKVVPTASTASTGSNVDLTSVSTHIIPDTSGAYDIGSSGKPFSHLYLESGSLYLGGTKVSLIVLGETHLNRFKIEPALSFVPEPLAPPNGCCPTTAPVGLSLM